LFLLDGQPLGDMVSIDTKAGSAGTGIGAVFTRTLPAGLKSGSHRVELVTFGQPALVLASQTLEVVVDHPPQAVDEPTSGSPPPISTSLPGLTVALGIGTAAAVAGVGFGMSTRSRRKTNVRRIGNSGR
jgi:hypothetical protein